MVRKRALTVICHPERSVSVGSPRSGAAQFFENRSMPMDAANRLLSKSPFPCKRCGAETSVAMLIPRTNDVPEGLIYRCPTCRGLTWVDIVPASEAPLVFMTATPDNGPNR
jgi:hypothetical protein